MLVQYAFKEAKLVYALEMEMEPLPTNCGWAFRAVWKKCQFLYFYFFKVVYNLLLLLLLLNKRERITGCSNLF